MKPPPVTSKSRTILPEAASSAASIGRTTSSRYFRVAKPCSRTLSATPRGGLQHQRPDRGHRHRDHRQPLRPGRKLRRHQREIVVLALEVEFCSGLPAAPDRTQRPHILAQPRRRRDPGHAEPPLVVRLHLAAQTQHEAPVGMPRQIPGVVGNDHRAARKRDRDRGRQVPRARSPARRMPAARTDLPQLVAVDTVEAVLFGRLGRRAAGAPVLHRQYRRYAHRVSPPVDWSRQFAVGAPVP